MASQRPLYRFSVDEYERMGEVGILGEDNRVELIQGEIVEMSPIGGRHVAAVTYASRSAFRQVTDDVLVQVQSPVRLPQDGEPLPDLLLVRAGYDEERIPDASDVLLVGEVSDTTLDYDRNVKRPLYAAAGIPEAWLFNLGANRIERHTDPQPGGYRTVAFAEKGLSLPSTVLPNFVFDVNDVLGIRPRR